MNIKPMLFLLLLLRLEPGVAQLRGDYLVTRQNDTLYGHVSEYGVLSAKGDVAVGRGQHRKYFKYTEIIEWRNLGKTHMVHQYKDGKGRDRYILLAVEINGKIRLLSDPMAEEYRCWVYIKGVFFRLPDHDLAREIWPIMLKCAGFASMYGNVPEAEVNAWNHRLRVKYFEAAIRFYNARCDN